MRDFPGKAGQLNYYVAGFLFGMGKKKRATQSDIWKQLRGDANLGLCDSEYMQKQYDPAIGYCQTALHRLAIRMPVRWLPLYVLMRFANLMTLMENPLTGGLGAFAVWGTLLYVMIHFLVSTLSRDTEAAIKSPMLAGWPVPPTSSPIAKPPAMPAE